MQDFLEKIYGSFQEFYSVLSFRKKISFIFLSIAILTIMAGIISWASKTRFSVLYTDLNSTDSKNISILLEENKVPYQLSDSNKTISIPEDMSEIWRIKLATMGVDFSGTVGYEVFDKQSFGTTSFVQKVNKQRALEGEITKTLKFLRGVKRARVHLSIPEVSPFVSEKKPATASIVLELERGVVLTEAEIKGVASLVSSSVDEMRPSNVVIIDTRGKKLSQNIGDPLTELTASRVALESKMNRNYESQIEEILRKVIGDGKVIAKVAVSLDYTESVKTETKYDNENTAILSEVKNSQNINGSRPSPQGFPGARSNIPGETPQPGVPETKNKVNKELTTRNYQVPKSIIKSRSPTAIIQKINAAIMIDGRHVPMFDEKNNPVLDSNGKQKVIYEKWSEADIANFSAIVASTLGTSKSRGDIIVIKNMEFATMDLEKADAILRERENRELIKNLVKYFAVGLTISLFFFLVVRPFVQWLTDNTVESIEDFLPKTLLELEKIQTNQKLPGLEDALPQIEEKLNPEKIEGNMLRERIISLVESNPSKAAQILHDLIHTSESDRQIA